MGIIGLHHSDNRKLGIKRSQSAPELNDPHAKKRKVRELVKGIVELIGQPNTSEELRDIPSAWQEITDRLLPQYPSLRNFGNLVPLLYQIYQSKNRTYIEGIIKKDPKNSLIQHPFLLAKNISEKIIHDIMQDLSCSVLKEISEYNKKSLCQQTAKELGEVIIADNGTISPSSLTKKEKLKIWADIISKMTIPPALKEGLNLTEATYQKYHNNKRAYIKNATEKIVARYYEKRQFEKNMSQSLKIDPVFPSTPSPDDIIAEIARNVISDLNTDVLKSKATYIPTPLSPPSKEHEESPPCNIQNCVIS